jgi:hypothetical protein
VTGGRRLVAIATGLIAFAAVGAAGLLLLPPVWPAYAAALPGKTFSTAMLLARLAVGVVACGAAGAAAGRLDGGRAGWIVGVVVLAVATWSHVVRVWADYPAWYHAAFLLPLAPLVAVAAHRVSRR